MVEGLRGGREVKKTQVAITFMLVARTKKEQGELVIAAMKAVDAALSPGVISMIEIKDVSEEEEDG